MYRLLLGALLIAGCAHQIPQKSSGSRKKSSSVRSTPQLLTISPASVVLTVTSEQWLNQALASYSPLIRARRNGLRSPATTRMKVQPLQNSVSIVLTRPIEETPSTPRVQNGETLPVESIELSEDRSQLRLVIKDKGFTFIVDRPEMSVSDLQNALAGIVKLAIR